MAPANPATNDVQPVRNAARPPEALAQVDVLAARARAQRSELGVGHRADEREQAAGEPDGEEPDGVRHGLRDDARRDEDADADDVRDDDGGGVEGTETAFERVRRRFDGHGLHYRMSDASPISVSVGRAAPRLLRLRGLAARSPAGDEAAGPQDRQAAARARMVDEQIARAACGTPPSWTRCARCRGTCSSLPGQVADAYDDTPLPIGHGQTISQPYIVALMTELARPQPTDRALEIGTGCGYQAAVLSRLVRRGLHDRDRRAARHRGKGKAGAAWLRQRHHAHRATATRAGRPTRRSTSSSSRPRRNRYRRRSWTNCAQRGRLVIPVGGLLHQNLELIEKDEGGRLHSRVVAPVRFVPMIKKGPD